MPTARPRVYVTFHDSTHAILKRFADEHELSLSELVAAICYPVARSMAWEIANREEEQPSLFPDALVDLYRSDPHYDQQEAAEDLERALGALREMTLAAQALGYQENPEDAGEDGATAPPAAAPAGVPPALPGASATPGCNTGVKMPERRSKRPKLALVKGGDR